MIPLEVDLDIDIDEPLDLEIDTRVEGGGHSGSCFPDVTASDNRKIMQVSDGQWKKQYPELGDESVHLLTNLEIEALIRSADGG